MKPGPLVCVDVMTSEEQDRRNNIPTHPTLVGLAEVAALLEVSKTRASQLRSRPDFPNPLAELASGPIWDKAMLLRFIEEWPRKAGRPSKEAVEGREKIMAQFEGDFLRRKATARGGA